MEDSGELRRRVVANTFPCFSTVAEAIHELGFVQADPIRSPARAQDLILRHRVANYTAGDLERLYPDFEVEEGFLFAYGFAAPKVWEALRDRGGLKMTRLHREVLNAVAELGEAHPREVQERFGKESVVNAWGGRSAATKRVLEDLHDHGLLRVARRERGVRVYGAAAARGEDRRSGEERFSELILATVRAFGPTTQRFVLSELRWHRHLVPEAKKRDVLFASLVEGGLLVQGECEGVVYVWIPGSLEETKVSTKARILAPFDPLVRDRERFVHFWKWEYRFEAYVPASKRVRGYYAMPVLWKDAVVGWANAKVEKGILNVEFGYATKKPKDKAFQREAEREVAALARFLGLEKESWELLGI